MRLRVWSALILMAVVAVALVNAQGTPITNVVTTAGQRVFAANCVACHQVTGAGIPTVFPPLIAHVPEMAAVEGGRRYLIDLVLYGLTGRIEVAGLGYDGLMPPWGHLSDSQLADVLNYVATAWDNRYLLPPGFMAFTPEEVLAARLAALDAAGVYDLRQTLMFE